MRYAHINVGMRDEARGSGIVVRDTVETHGVRLTVDRMDGRRVDKIKVVVSNDDGSE